MTPDAIIDTLIGLDPLADLPRTGWVLRGIAAPESLAAHSFGVAVVASMLTDAIRAGGAEVDGERVLRMALVHDAAEARTGDVPMPNKSPAVSAALHELEAGIVEQLLPESYRDLWKEAESADTLEARIVKASDKIQMMIKILVYERYRSARLDDFWVNPGNFRDMGLAEASAVYDAICVRADRKRPT
jgi:putative hydrolase of HD superfamily